MEGINYENDKYSLEENVLNGRLEIKWKEQGSQIIYS